MIRRILGLSRTRRRSTSNATQNIEGSSLNDDGVAARPSLDCLAIDLEDTIVTTSQGRATGSEGTAEASSTSSCRLQGPRISSTINSQHLARSNPRSPLTAVSRGRLRPKDQIKRLKGFGRQKSRKSAQGDAAEKGEEEAKGEGNAAAAAAEVQGTAATAGAEVPPPPDPLERQPGREVPRGPEEDDLLSKAAQVQQILPHLDQDLILHHLKAAGGRPEAALEALLAPPGMAGAPAAAAAARRPPPPGPPAAAAAAAAAAGGGRAAGSWPPGATKVGEDSDAEDLENSGYEVDSATDDGVTEEEVRSLVAWARDARATAAAAAAAGRDLGGGGGGGVAAEELEAAAAGAEFQAAVALADLSLSDRPQDREKVARLGLGLLLDLVGARKSPGVQRASFRACANLALATEYQETLLETGLVERASVEIQNHCRMLGLPLYYELTDDDPPQVEIRDTASAGIFLPLDTTADLVSNIGVHMEIEEKSADQAHVLGTEYMHGNQATSETPLRSSTPLSFGRRAESHDRHEETQYNANDGDAPTSGEKGPRPHQPRAGSDRRGEASPPLTLRGAGAGMQERATPWLSMGAKGGGGEGVPGGGEPLLLEALGAAEEACRAVSNCIFRRPAAEARADRCRGLCAALAALAAAGREEQPGSLVAPVGGRGRFGEGGAPAAALALAALQVRVEAMAALANICRNANLLGPPCKAWRTLHLALRPKTLWGVSSSLRYAEVEEECMLQALRLFTNASCNPIHQRRIVQQGCLTSLVDLLQHRDGTHYSTLAATCLANLSSLKANRQAMILLNIPSLLLVPLQQEAKGTQFQLARALCNLLAAADWSTKNQLTQKGLLATVLGIMKTSTDLNAPSAEKISSSQYEGPVDNLSCVRQRALSDEVRHHGIAEEEVEMGLSSDLNAICSKILSCTLTSSMQHGAAFSW